MMDTWAGKTFEYCLMLVSILAPMTSTAAGGPDLSACRATNGVIANYQACLQAADPALAQALQKLPGGANGLYQKIEAMGGPPASTWTSGGTPPSIDQIAQYASGNSPQFRERFLAIMKDAQQKLAARQGNTGNSNVAQLTPQKPGGDSLGSKIASFFHSEPDPQPQAAAVASSETMRTASVGKLASARDPSNIAEDPGVSLFKRVAQKYQDLAPRMAPQMTGDLSHEVLRDFGK